MTPSAHESEVTRFVHALIKGGWLDEVNRGLALELRPEDYPSELLLHVVFEMLCGTIETATESLDPADLSRATEIIDLAATRVEEHLRRAYAFAERMPDDGDDDRRKRA